jgi:hypothetical protein
VNQREFINWLIPYVQNVNVLKSLIVSQICLESGFGKHHFHNNYLGIKFHKNVRCMEAKTKEFVNGNYKDYKLAFAVYDDISDCIADYCDIIGNARYKPVREAKDWTVATEQIRKCGYATSPTYTENLRKIIEKYKLYELDYKMNPNTKLTTNFIWKEFFCKDIEPPEDYHIYILLLATELQKVRDAIGKPIHITSGYRTKEYNGWLIAQGYHASKNSLHLVCKAVDSKCNSLSLQDYALYLARYTNFGGIGIGNGFVHGDLRLNFTIIHY